MEVCGKKRSYLLCLFPLDSTDPMWLKVYKARQEQDIPVSDKVYAW
jgi:hypothetical protein